MSWRNWGRVLERCDEEVSHTYSLKWYWFKNRLGIYVVVVAQDDLTGKWKTKKDLTWLMESCCGKWREGGQSWVAA
jgi:hypothetical protein